MTRTAIAIGVAALALGLCRSGFADPSTERLILVGVAVAPADYILGVSLHEASHAAMAKLLGATVEDFRVFPPGVDPRTQTFRFGWTYVRGLNTRTARVGFYAAPKLTDALLLTGFAALVFTDTWPRNKYGQLALTVASTGLWVDFAKDVVLFSPYNDVSQVFANLGLTGWRQVPARLLYAAASVGFGFGVVRSYQRLFDTERNPAAVPMLIPIIGGGF